MEDVLKYQTCPLVKYRQNQNHKLRSKYITNEHDGKLIE